MASFGKILVAFDGSDSSRNALRQTIDKFQDSWLKVLAVVPSYEGELELVGIRNKEELRRGPRESLLHEIQEIVGPDAERTRIDVEQGDAYEQIVDTAENEQCTLIVMGRRGLQRVERMLMGSVTVKVLVHTSADVLVVPRDGEINWDNIVLATDGSAFSEAALEMGLEYASRFNSDLTAISVVDMYPEYYADAGEVVEKMERKATTVLDAVRRKAEDAGVKLHTQALHGDPAEEITKYARDNSAGIIFMGNRGRSGLKKIFLGSVAEKVIGLSGCPVFVAKTV